MKYNTIDIILSICIVIITFSDSTLFGVVKAICIPLLILGLLYVQICKCECVKCETDINTTDETSEGVIL